MTSLDFKRILTYPEIFFYHLGEFKAFSCTLGLIWRSGFNLRVKDLSNLPFGVAGHGSMAAVIEAQRLPSGVPLMMKGSALGSQMLLVIFQPESRTTQRWRLTHHDGLKFPASPRPNEQRVLGQLLFILFFINVFYFLWFSEASNGKESG